VSGGGLLLLRGDAERALSWASKGLVTVDVVPQQQGWVAVVPAGPASAVAPPYDDPVAALLARPVPRRLLPAIGVATVGPRLVLGLVPAVLRPRRRWLVWEPGAGLVRPGSLPAATIADLAAIARHPQAREALTRMLRDGRGDADGLARDIFATLELPGAGLLTDPPAADAPGVRRVEPSSKDVGRFERLVTEDRRWREEVSGS